MHLFAYSLPVWTQLTKSLTDNPTFRPFWHGTLEWNCSLPSYYSRYVMYYVSNRARSAGKLCAKKAHAWFEVTPYFSVVEYRFCVAPQHWENIVFPLQQADNILHTFFCNFHIPYLLTVVQSKVTKVSEFANNCTIIDNVAVSSYEERW